MRHLQYIVKNGDVLPDLADDPYGPVDQPVPSSLLTLIGSIDDPEVPTDCAENSDVYAHEAAMWRHAQSASTGLSSTRV